MDQHETSTNTRYGPTWEKYQHKIWTNMRQVPTQDMDRHETSTNTRYGPTWDKYQHKIWTDMRQVPTQDMDQYETSTNTRYGPTWDKYQHKIWTDMRQVPTQDMDRHETSTNTRYGPTWNNQHGPTQDSPQGLTQVMPHGPHKTGHMDHTGTNKRQATRTNTRQATSKARTNTIQATMTNTRQWTWTNWRQATRTNTIQVMRTNIGPTWNKPTGPTRGKANTWQATRQDKTSTSSMVECPWMPFCPMNTQISRKLSFSIMVEPRFANSMRTGRFKLANRHTWEVTNYDNMQIQHSPRHMQHQFNTWQGSHGTRAFVGSNMQRTQVSNKQSTPWNTQAFTYVKSRTEHAVFIHSKSVSGSRFNSSAITFDAFIYHSIQSQFVIYFFQTVQTANSLLLSIKARLLTAVINVN